jgi:hypothetical protein
MKKTKNKARKETALSQNSARPSFREGKRISCSWGVTVSDVEGHYDIDGVSFKKEVGVIVASDARPAQ